MSAGTLKKNIIRQRPRLLYAGVNNAGLGWVNEKTPCENAELILVCKGMGKAEIGDEEYPFKAGDLIILNGGVSHREFLDETPEREIVFAGIGNLHIYGQESDKILKDRDFCIIHTENYFNALRCYLTQLVAEAEGTQPLSEAIAENLLKIILMFAVRLSSFDKADTFNMNMSYLKAKEYFDEHFAEIDSIDGVCKSLFVNKYFLAHLFSQNLGMPPVKYLIQKRIEHACKCLETSDMNVADIGKACGFADPCYFSRIFKKTKGVTPLRYRYLFKLDRDEKENAKKNKK